MIRTFLAAAAAVLTAAAPLPAEPVSAGIGFAMLSGVPAATISSMGADTEITLYVWFTS